MTSAQEYVGLSDSDFLRESVGLVEKARQKDVALRILGSLGVYAHSLHSPETIATFHALGRVEQGKPLFTDLDLMGYARQGRFISGLFRELEFKPDEVVNGFFGDRRLIYYEPSGRFHVDIFLDKLEFSHDVLFGSKPGEGRLELDFPTITLADIVLEKLQIHRIARKDLVDILILLLGHEVRGSASPGRELVDDQYIAGILGDDWGFWHEAVQNLAKARQLLTQFAQGGNLAPEQVASLNTRIGALEQRLQTSPKSKKWEKRARAGTNKPWYREVEEVVR